MFGGFRERAEQTYGLLQAPGTAFLVVAAPEPDALREASYFVERLSAETMPLAGLVLNRVHRSGAPTLSAERGRGRCRAAGRGRHDALAAGALRVHAERMQLAARERRLRDRFTAPTRTVPVAEVPARPPTSTTWTACAAIGTALAG